MATSARTRSRPTWVVIPARNEEQYVERAITALGDAAAAIAAAVHLVVVDDASTDRTPHIVRRELDRWRHGSTHVLAGPAAGVGWARRVGLERALAGAGTGTDTLIATTDADSRVPRNWLQAMHALVDSGHEVIAGDVKLDDETDPRLVAERDRRLAQRMAAVLRQDPSAQHPHHAGANLAWTARALHALTPLPAPEALEDDALYVRCQERGLAVVRDASFAVRTSGRTKGRAAEGLATALAADGRRLGIVPA